MDYPVLAGCGLTRLDAAKVLPPGSPGVPERM